MKINFITALLLSSLFMFPLVGCDVPQQSVTQQIFEDDDDDFEIDIDIDGKKRYKKKYYSNGKVYNQKSYNYSRTSQNRSTSGSNKSSSRR